LRNGGTESHAHKARLNKLTCPEQVITGPAMRPALLFPSAVGEELNLRFLFGECVE
jgi:hypothetical protein